MNNNKEIKNLEKNYDLIKFEDGNFSLDVNVSPSVANTSSNGRII